jgi:hypothetical protein
VSGAEYLLAALDPLVGYGPVPGVELIPYFLGLLAWVGLALASIVLSPLSALLRRLRRGRSAPPPEPASEAMTAPEPEREGRHDSV